MAAPVVYSFFWFSVFGGAGLRMEREAALRGIDCTTPVSASHTKGKAHLALSVLPFRWRPRLWCV